MEETRPADNGARLRDAASTLFKEWREVMVQAYDEAEKFTKERPAAGMLGSFLAGLLVGILVPRR